MRFLLPLALAACAAGALPTPDELRIRGLPGYTARKNFEMYSGSLPVTSEHNLFFWYIKSPNDHKDMPLSFWFTGGPGCSSMAALTTEQGPFWPVANGTQVDLNDAAWTEFMNMVWVDSPAGVGFSTASAPYDPNDSLTAKEAHMLIQQFFTVFPDLRQKTVYITGESYGGHYVPNLVVEILGHNAMLPHPTKEGQVRDSKMAEAAALLGVTKAVSFTTGETFGHINLNGFAAGNPLTWMPYLTRGSAEYEYSHAIISTDTYNGLINDCGMAWPASPTGGAGRNASFMDRLRSAIHAEGPLRGEWKGSVAATLIASASNPFECSKWMNQAQAQFKYLTIYDVYQDICVGEPIIPPVADSIGGARVLGSEAAVLHELVWGETAEQASKRTRATLGAAVEKDILKSSAARAATAAATPKDPFEPLQPPIGACGEFFASDWLNRADVQAAIHAPAGRRWHMCSNEISGRYSRHDILANVIPKYLYVLEYMRKDMNFHFLVYSGDFDDAVPFPGTRKWIEALDEPVHTPHSLWMSRNQTGGWIQTYRDGRFAFATVRGAGHMVPSTRPQRGFDLIRSFIENRLIPNQ